MKNKKKNQIKYNYHPLKIHKFALFVFPNFLI